MVKVSIILPPAIVPGQKTDIRDWGNHQRSLGKSTAEIREALLNLPRIEGEQLKKQVGEMKSAKLKAKEKNKAATGTTNDLTAIETMHGQTDAANARRFINLYHSELLYVPPWKDWLSWDGQRWARNNGVGVNQRAQRYAASLWDAIAKAGKASTITGDDMGRLVKFVSATNQAKAIDNFIKLARVDERIVCPVDELNSDPNLLNCVNGTIDLTTGKLRPHNPADRITQLANVVYDPNATCPRWLETLGLIFNGKQDVIRYVQQLLGYSISGDTGEHLLPIAYGKGCNGKSTVWNSVAHLLGDYATLANDELLLGDKSNHPTEKAALYQKRFVAISEPEKSSRLRESRVKELTGDRMITARRMNENFWTFQRTHTFWLSTNHLPRIDGTDEGVWRRVKLIPFTVDLRDKVKPIPDFDKWLILNEGPGILAWLVRGFLDYQGNGLQEPEIVTEATSKYRGESDPLGDFIADYCVESPEAEVGANDFYQAYREQFKGQLNQNEFAEGMKDRFEKCRPNSGQFRKKTIYKGVRLRREGEVILANAQLQETQQKQGLPTPAHTNLARSYGNPVLGDLTETVWAGVGNGQNSPSLDATEAENSPSLAAASGNGHCQHVLGPIITFANGKQYRQCQLCPWSEPVPAAAREGGSDFD